MVLLPHSVRRPMWPVIALISGIALCVAGGLLGLWADPERPLKFVPAYVLAAALFLLGLAVVSWFQPVGEYLARATAV